MQSRRKRSRQLLIPTWSHSPPGVRVLVEHPEPIAREFLAEGLQARGYAVVTCGGPSPEDLAGAVRCPLLDGESCPAVGGADVVVTSLNPLGDHEGLIVRNLTNHTGAPSVIVEATDWQMQQAQLSDVAAVRHQYPFHDADTVAAIVEATVSAHATGSH